jgi:hypothetical protein
MGDARMSQITQLRHPTAGTPSVQYSYHDETGEPVFIANRFERPGKKLFIPFDLKAQEWKAPEQRPLYRLSELKAANENRPVIVTEGEKCADALAGLGYVTTTTFGGANAPHKTDLSPLRGRIIIIWPDKDEAGQKYAAKLSLTLYKEYDTAAKTIPTSDIALYKVMNHREGTPPLTYGKGWDAADAIAQGWGVKEINRLIDLASPPAVEAPETNNGEDAPQLFDDMELWHTPDGRPYTSIKRGAHWETFALGGSAFKQLLAHEEFRSTGKSPPKARLGDMTRQMVGQALYEGAQRPVFTRIGEHGTGYVLDLGATNWSTVEITASGWKNRNGREPRFKRAPSMSALPQPVPGTGDINLLRQFVNAGSDQDFQLMVGWLLGSLRPSGPYPMLILTGEQGSAKSTTSKVLRSLVDPSTLATRSFPTDERDLVIAAQGAHVLAFDNLSRVKPAMADALCRISTGGGFATRRLHSDDDEVLFDATRPCILNGIPDLGERADLADRAIILTLPTISETKRAFEGDFWEAFKEAQPRILAGLLDAMCCAMARVDSVTLSERPRMADFARWVTAAEPALEWTQGAFMEAYSANRQESAETALDNNNVAAAVLALMQAEGEWRGTAADLILTLRKRFPALTEPAEAFPRQPSSFGSELRRITPLLRRQGITIEREKVGKDRTRILSLKQA